MGTSVHPGTLFPVEKIVVPGGSCVKAGPVEPVADKVGRICVSVDDGPEDVELEGVAEVATKLLVAGRMIRWTVGVTVLP